MKFVILFIGVCLVLVPRTLVAQQCASCQEKQEQINEKNTEIDWRQGEVECLSDCISETAAWISWFMATYPDPTDEQLLWFYSQVTYMQGCMDERDELELQIHELQQEINDIEDEIAACTQC